MGCHDAVYANIRKQPRAVVVHDAWKLSCNRVHGCCGLQDPVTELPAVLVKRYNISQQKELELQLAGQQAALQRYVLMCIQTQAVIQKRVPIGCQDSIVYLLHAPHSIMGILACNLEPFMCYRSIMKSTCTHALFK